MARDREYQRAYSRAWYHWNKGQGPRPYITPRPSVDERFFSKVHMTDGCWLWTAQLNEGGYGHFWLSGRNRLAHRVAYEQIVGPIPEGLTLDHLCRNPACVRPEHLEPVTGAENSRRGYGFGGINARKTHCWRGHELAGANLYVAKSGYRHCRECQRIRAAARQVGGGRLYGDRHPNARLSDDQVQQVRAIYAQGNQTTYVLAKEFGVDPSTIQRIVKGKARRYAYDPEGPLELVKAT